MIFDATIHTHNRRLSTEEEDEFAARKLVRGDLKQRSRTLTASAEPVKITSKALLGIIHSVILTVMMVAAIQGDLFPGWLIMWIALAPWSLVILPVFNAAMLPLVRHLGHLLARWDWWVDAYMVEEQEAYYSITGEVTEHFETPMEVELDLDAHPPQIHWEPTGVATIQSSAYQRRTEEELVGSAPFLIPTEGTLSLSSKGTLAFDLTRSQKSAHTLFVTCKAHTPGQGAHQVTLVCRKPDWMSRARMENLATMERVGIEIDADDNDDFLAALAKAAQATGRPIEALKDAPTLRTAPAQANAQSKARRR